MSVPDSAQRPPEMQAFCKRLEAVLLRRLDRWSQSGPEDREAAVEGLSPNGVQRELFELLVDVEDWYGRRHDAEVRGAAAARGVLPGAWLTPAAERGWLQGRLARELEELLGAVIDLQAAARANLRFARAKAEPKGLWRGLADAARLLATPWKLPAAARAELGLLREAARLDEALTRQATRLEEAWQVLGTRFEDAVIDRWNEVTVPLLDRIAATPVAS